MGMDAEHHMTSRNSYEMLVNELKLTSHLRLLAIQNEMMRVT